MVYELLWKFNALIFNQKLFWPLGGVALGMEMTSAFNSSLSFLYRCSVDMGGGAKFGVFGILNPVAEFGETATPKSD
jgi:hypothetical protein